MKPKIIITMLCLFFLSACDEKKEKEEIVQEEVQIDLLNDEFPEAKAEIKQIMDDIAKTVKDGDIDKLIGYHAYNSKFTEFKNGELRNDASANEAFEREVFGGVTEVVKFNFDDLKIAVFDKVANVTFHSDFQLQFGDDAVSVNDQITLLMVKTDNGWKIVHEHHSPIKPTEEL